MLQYLKASDDVKLLHWQLDVWERNVANQGGFELCVLKGLWHLKLVVVDADVVQAIRRHAAGHQHLGQGYVFAAANVKQVAVLAMLGVAHPLCNVCPTKTVGDVVAMDETALFRLINAQVGIVNGLSSGVSHNFLLELKDRGRSP